jgi:hypothetical protein
MFCTLFFYLLPTFGLVCDNVENFITMLVLSLKTFKPEHVALQINIS